MIDKKFNRLTVLRDLGVINRRTRWLCKCDCGKTKIIIAYCVKSGHTKSCGCLGVERRHEAVTHHGKTGTKEYRTWKAMKTRCLNKNAPKYLIYGKRGIAICDKWLESFENFFEDMGLCPEDCNSIERIDNEKDYSPNNCEWSNPKKQSNNTRQNLMITFNGKTQTLTQWCEELKLNYYTIWSRISKRKWKIEKALTIPIRGMKSNLNGGA